MKKPIKKSELVWYWDCGDELHRHRKEGTAELCIARRKNRSAAALADKPEHWGPDGHAKVLSMFRAGMRKSDLARRFRVSPSRITEIIKTAERRESADPMESDCATFSIS
jgi:hypothetical protein